MTNSHRFIYMAAGIFNAETNMYSSYLTKKLESAGYECYLPIRDGFETGKIFAFLSTAQKLINEKENPHLAEQIALYVPYYLDLGYFMSQSIGVVANLDEPVDIGMVVEMSYAKICQIPVVGVRTDLRSPLGNWRDIMGINPFPVEQCDCYIRAATPRGDYGEVMRETEAIADKVLEELAKWIPQKQNRMAESDNPIFKRIIEGSKMLFDGIDDDIHKPENMKKIITRFVDNRETLLAIAPELVRFPDRGAPDEQAQPGSGLQGEVHSMFAARKARHPKPSADSGRNSHEIEDNQTVTFKGSDGIAVFSAKIGGTRAEYRWRYSLRGTELSGKGRVFEKWGSSSTGGEGAGIDLGVEVFQVGPYVVEWSMRGQSSSWLYAPADVDIATSETSLGDYPL